MKKVLFLVCAVCAIVFSSCSKDKDNNPSYTATVTVNNSTYSFSEVEWYDMEYNSTTIYNISAYNESDDTKELELTIADKKTGTYTTNGTTNEITVTIGSDSYKSVDSKATITVTTADSKTLGGTFTGQFYKNNSAETTYTISGSFTSAYASLTK
jgi:hypothetical protein